MSLVSHNEGTIYADSIICTANQFQISAGDHRNYTASVGILDPLMSGPKTKMSYFFMSRAAGVTLESLWLEFGRSHELPVQQQLIEIFSVLRSIITELAHGEVNFGGFVSSLCKDAKRSVRTSGRLITTEADFNEFLSGEPGRTQTFGSKWFDLS